MLIRIQTSHIFDCIEKDTSETQFAIKCSYLEIYNENINDLLTEKKNDLTIKQKQSTAPFVNVNEIIHAKNLI